MFICFDDHMIDILFIDKCFFTSCELLMSENIAQVLKQRLLLF